MSYKALYDILWPVKRHMISRVIFRCPPEITSNLATSPWLQFSLKCTVLIYVDFFVLFLYPTTEVWNYRRGCLLKQDMSADDNANCCSGRLSIGDLQGHMLWVFFRTSLVEVDRDCVIQEKHINDSMVVRYFRAFPVCRHVCFRQKPCFDPSPRCALAVLSSHLACWENCGERQPRKFENLTSLACQRKHFRVFCMILGCFYSC